MFQDLLHVESCEEQCSIVGTTCDALCVVVTGLVRRLGGVTCGRDYRAGEEVGGCNLWA